ncbi:MAG: citramalate synthase [Deltaproteobacteria bacterium]|nr:citramalate synthase [Deltaproteobacteria bacterium]
MNDTEASTLKRVFLYDTTLRDGSQRAGISFSISDKLKITKLLDLLGVSYIEGGWPGSNPKDCAYFKKVRELDLKHAKIAAFGSTRRTGQTVEEDSNLKALLDAHTPVVTLVGKTWTLHVNEILRASLDENINMISESVQYLKSHGREVIYDAEHFFDGYLADPQYAISTLMAAYEAGADAVVLCDTNGGSTPDRIGDIVQTVRSSFPGLLGIHTHNDSELAVANSLAAVQAGCSQVQGTINGYGERCGNANLISIIANLQLKLGFNCVPEEGLRLLSQVSNKVCEIANLNPDNHAAFVGSSAFAHKGGIHVAAVEKNPCSYEHIDPEVVGNRRTFVISELSGRGNVRVRAAELGLKLQGNEKAVLNKIKELESEGFQLENAEGTFELLVRQDDPAYQAPFEVIDMMVVSERRRGDVLSVEAMIKLKVGSEIFHTVCDGNGPVHALDGAIRKALVPAFPELAQVRLADYKVRILDPDKATGATTRVTLEATSGSDRWSTVGVAQNIIDASFRALADSYELYLLRNRATGGVMEGNHEV